MTPSDGTLGLVNRPNIGQNYSPKRNSLNFLRMILALMVVVSHVGLGGFRDPFLLNHTTIGIVAVYGFFGISGFLIAGSASRNGVGRYLWQRCLRILPGFWVCLAVTAFGFGILATIHGVSNGHHCDLSCYF